MTKQSARKQRVCDLRMICLQVIVDARDAFSEEMNEVMMGIRERRKKGGAV